MKITAIKTAATLGHGMHLWVRVETDEGISGLGECVHGGVQAIAIIHELRAGLIGRDPLQIDAIFEELRRGHVFDGGFAGALITALTGIELALWDLKGKALGAPVYALLGGKFRDSIRVYADCQVEPSMDFGEIERVVQGVVARGFTALKIDLDIGAYTGDRSRAHGRVKDAFNHTADQWEHERMLELVDMTTRAAGRDVAVAVDVHTRLDVPSAIRLARDLQQFHLLWLEEPVPPENIDAMREVKRASATPICAGENLYLRHGFRDLIVKQAVDIIMPDIPKCGGLSECRKIANLAELYYIPFAPHNVASPIGTMASAHVCASVPNFLVLEFHWLHRDYWRTITADGEDIIKDGYIALSERPGIGVELNEAVARAHQFPGTAWFE
ncbi:MAG TPA: mandelate racemase/muconate lactonizing enzyme family protein [Kouleothrix sp.]|uniref:mandelate racemase/muconate lactonizing enzyme family protein n=1 Tax=Kouleothrix sp. TaxID=2779161 RepID=UPI002C88A78F|nr:mandelate racemase/muconate lactonizing enzyme family protein [Kouleothrix sp.]HRC75330.1 mandelate racemase/muconate lactonizing enzyme family protein [Kouleothrix sp.]